MKYIKKNTNNQSSNKLTKRCKIAKKISVAVIAALTIMAMAAMTVALQMKSKKFANKMQKMI